MLKSICLIGAGNIGSRHLQALAKVHQPLLIQIVDPSLNSLAIAKARYEETATAQSKHQVSFLQSLTNIISPIDIAIVATTSDIRAYVTQQLLTKSHVKDIIFEKLLFNKKYDYEKIGKLLDKKGCRAWVNCVMRLTSFYYDLKNYFQNQTIQYILTGGGFELITSSIHYIDHVAFLTGCYDFKVDTNHLFKIPVQSKRKGFLELNGTLNFYFKDGSVASLTVLPTNNLTLILEIFSKDYRFIRNELENKNYYSMSKDSWKLNSQIIPTPYQSQITNLIVGSLLETDTCQLTPFDKSAEMHLLLLEPLLNFLNSNSKKKFKHYPFT